MMIYSLFGALDANANWLFGAYAISLSLKRADKEPRQPLVQASPVAANVFIWMSFFVALLNYIRFAREVIWQM